MKLCYDVAVISFSITFGIAVFPSYIFSVFASSGESQYDCVITVFRDCRHDSLLSMGKSSTLLAQIFSLLIRQLAETLDNIYEVSNCPTPPYVLPALSTDPIDLYKFVWAELEEVWVWLFNSMDMLESQLRFGSSMSRKVIPLVCVSV